MDQKKITQKSKSTQKEKDIRKDTVQLHGMLYHAYRHAIGWRIFKAAYIPAQRKWNTWALWMLTAVLGALPFGVLCVDITVARWLPLVVFLLMVCFYFPIADYCIRVGLIDDYARIGIVGQFTQQPKRLVRALLHHGWFSHDVRHRINPSIAQLERCLDFMESNRKDLPPSWTSYFRHPLVVLIIGIFLYTLNLKIADLMKQDSSAIFNGWSVPIVVLSCVVLVLMAGWLFYSSHYAGREDDWRFERCVRWYLSKRLLSAVCTT